MENKTQFEQAVEQVTKALTDEGRLIEAGFTGFRAMAIHPQANPRQVEEMRWAFFAGAQHLFGSLCTIMDEDTDEITEADAARMDSVAKELGKFAEQIALRFTPAKGGRQ